MNVINVA